MRTIRLLAVCGLLLAGCGQSEPASIVDLIGRKVPISTGTWLQHNGDAPPQLIGTWVIIDFWASWCAPCVESMPYLDSLTANLPPDRMVLVSIAVRDTEERARAALRRIGISGNVCMDDGTKTNDAFMVGSVPQVVLIDPDGVLRWAGSPGQLTGDFLAHVLETGSIPDRYPGTRTDVASNFTMTIKPTVHRFSGSTSVSTGPVYYVEVKGGTYQAICEVLLTYSGVKRTLIRWPADAPLEPTLDVAIEGDSLRPFPTQSKLALDQMLSLLNITRSVRVKADTVHVLRVVDAARLRAHPARVVGRDDDVSPVEGGMHTLLAHSLDALINMLEGSFHHTILNESGVSADETFSLSYPFESMDAVARHLRETYGLSLTRELREVEYHVLDTSNFTNPFKE